MQFNRNAWTTRLLLHHLRAKNDKIHRIPISLGLLRIWWAGLAQSVQRLATGWTVQGSNPGGGEIFRTRPDRPWCPPSLLYNGYRVFPGGKAAGAWC